MNVAEEIAIYRLASRPRLDIRPAPGAICNEMVTGKVRPHFFDVLVNPLGTSLQTGAGWLLARPDARLLDRLTSAVRLFRRVEPLALLPNVFWRDGSAAR